MAKPLAFVGVFVDPADANYAEAFKLAKALRADKLRVAFRNARFFDPREKENFTHVVASSKNVLDAYANVITGGIELLQGLAQHKEKGEDVPSVALDDPSFGAMTREQLIEHASTMLGLQLPSGMRKADIFSAINNAKQPVAEVAALG